MTTQVATSSSASLKLLMQGRPTLAAVAAALEPLSRAERAVQVRALPGRHLGELWTLAQAGGELHVGEVVPPTTDPFKVLIWAGKNSLPAFSIFEKRVFRDQAGRVWGYNHQSMSAFTGPGYFSVVAHPERSGEVLFDYTRIPDTAPPGWPAIKSNARGISYLVYHQLKDEMRRVCSGVLIGKAFKGGKDMGQYFALVVQDA